MSPMSVWDRLNEPLDGAPDVAPDEALRVVEAALVTPGVEI